MPSSVEARRSRITCETPRRHCGAALGVQLVACSGCKAGPSPFQVHRDVCQTSGGQPSVACISVACTGIGATEIRSVEFQE